MARLLKIIFVIIIMFVGLSIVATSISYFTPDFEAGYLSDKKDIFGGIFSAGLYTHIISAPLLLLIGTIQVFRNTKADRLHRLLGKYYTYGVILFGGPSGVLLAFYAFGGIAGKVNFLILSLLWIYFTIMSFLAISKGNVNRHVVQAMSSYVLLLSAIFLRIFSYITINFTGFSITANTYVVISILSWLPMLLIVQLYHSVKSNKAC